MDTATAKTDTSARWLTGKLLSDAEPFLRRGQIRGDADDAPDNDPASQDPICQSAQEPTCCADCGSAYSADCPTAAEGCGESEPPNCPEQTAQDCPTAEGCAQTEEGCEDAMGRTRGERSDHTRRRVLVVG
jgi:hypothetical protein